MDLPRLLPSRGAPRRDRNYWAGQVMCDQLPRNQGFSVPHWWKKPTPNSPDVASLQRFPYKPTPYWVRAHIIREQQAEAARNANLVPPRAFEWCGISLDEPFRCPTSRQLLAPAEHNGIFKNKKHAKRYRKLVKALLKETERLKAQQKDDLKAEKARYDAEREVESQEFHSEFLARLSWGQPGCVLSMDPESLKTYIDRLGQEKLNSKFPTVNKYFEKFPNLSIAWAVDDFYKWQQVRYLENENLLRIKHLWDWYETCYKFLHATHLLRKEYESALQSWFYCLNSKPRSTDEAQSKAGQSCEWTPQKDEQRMMLQFATLKKIWKVCTDSGLSFPLDLCPGGKTPMEYFKAMAGPHSTDPEFGDPKTLFLRSHMRFDRRTIEGLEIANEIQTMLACETPQEYYRKNPHAAEKGVAVWECNSIRDDTNDSDVMLRNLSSESGTSSLNLDDSSCANSATGKDTDSNSILGGYSASAAGRIESTSFRKTVDPGDSPKSDDSWRSVRAGWPLGLRA